MTEEVVNPKALILPNVTTTQRDLLVCELGTIIYNTTTNKVNYCTTANTAGAGSWAAIA